MAFGSCPLKAAHLNAILALKQIPGVKSGSSFVISLGSDMTLLSVPTGNILGASLKGLSAQLGHGIQSHSLSH